MASSFASPEDSLSSAGAATRILALVIVLVIVLVLVL
jgi:hypothetical protein